MRRPGQEWRTLLACGWLPLVMVVIAFSFGASAEPGEQRSDVSERTNNSDSEERPGHSERGRKTGQLIQPEGTPGDWYVLFAWVNTYPELKSEKPIDQYFNPAMRLLAPGFDDVYTISDLRDDHLLWPPHIAIGRNFGKRWSASFEFGYATGKVRTKATDPTWLLLPLHTDFEIKRDALYWGPGLDYYPFGRVEMRARNGLGERLRGIRPSIGTRVTWTYASYDAKVKAELGRWGRFLNLNLHDSWSLTSVNFNIGADVPLTKNSLLHLNGGYNWFDHRQYDFEGTAYTVAYKWFFR
jgi:hypothetical protein